MHQMGDDWDDSALLEAFNRAVISHDGKISSDSSPIPKTAFPNHIWPSNEALPSNVSDKDPVDKEEDGLPDMVWRAVDDGTEDEEQTHDAKDSHKYEEEAATKQPFDRRGDDLPRKDLSALLHAWYRAGYEMGKYEALHGQKKNH